MPPRGVEAGECGRGRGAGACGGGDATGEIWL